LITSNSSTEIEGPVASSPEAIQLPRRDWYREVGMAPQFQHQMGAGKCMAPWAFFVTNPTNEPKMSVCIPAPPWVFFKGPTRTFHQLLLCENARPQSSDCRIDPGFQFLGARIEEEKDQESNDKDGNGCQSANPKRPPVFVDWCHDLLGSVPIFLGKAQPLSKLVRDGFTP
jgi:hypothetical protein